MSASRRSFPGGRPQPTKRGGTVSIEDALKRWLRASGAKRRSSKHAILSRWRELVGEEIAAQTRPIEVRSGELIVEVFSAPLLNELSTFCKEDILTSLREAEECRSIRGIRFRAGAT